MTRKKVHQFGAICFSLLFIVFLLAGCKGDTGSAGAPGAPGQDLTAGAANEQCLICHGPGAIANITDVHALSSQSPFTAPLTVTQLTATSGLVVDINQQNAAQLAGIKMAGTIDLVTIATVTPVVNFTITDGAGHGIVGLKANVSGANVVNLRVTLAQLVESATNSFPSYWQSYEVATATSRPTDEGTAANFVDNGNGTYTYTMNKNVTTVPGVTYDPNKTHRLAIRVFGAVAGGTLNEEPLDLTRDFVPAQAFPGTPIQHDIVAEGACDACHYQLGITTPHGGRDDPKYCVMCHTYQRANGRTASSPDANGVLTGSTNIVSGQVALGSDPTSTAGGFASGEFVRLIHQIHKGNKLSLQGYSYGGVLVQ